MCRLGDVNADGNFKAFIVSLVGRLCCLWVARAMLYLPRLLSVLFLRAFGFKVEAGVEFCPMSFWQL